MVMRKMPLLFNPPTFSPSPPTWRFGTLCCLCSAHFLLEPTSGQVLLGARDLPLHAHPGSPTSCFSGLSQAVQSLKLSTAKLGPAQYKHGVGK